MKHNKKINWNYLIVTAILLSLVGCGGNNADANTKAKVIIACDVLGNDYMKNRYPKAGEIKVNARNVSSSSTCTYTFKVDGDNHYIKFEIYAGNDEKALNESIRNRGDDGEPLAGIGKVAFQDKKIGQVNVWDGSHVFQVNASDGRKYNVEMATEIARDIMAKL